MMLKVLFYSYYTGVTSSRSIGDKLDTDTVYMYLSGVRPPDFRTPRVKANASHTRKKNKWKHISVSPKQLFNTAHW